MMEQEDPYRLDRFLGAQAEDYECAIRELRNGKKESHWMWYTFPQIRGLGFSSMAQDYAIVSLGEAKAYLEHPVLGTRLQECCAALLEHSGTKIESIMSDPDDMKLRSSMTLFAYLETGLESFGTVLDEFYGGYRDEKTIALLGSGC